MKRSPFKDALKKMDRTALRPRKNLQNPEDSTEQEEPSFASLMSGVKPLTQDTYVPPRKKPRPSKNQVQLKHHKQREASFAFSDIYQAHFNQHGPLKHCREDVPTFELKRLRRGDYYPEYVLDLHGLTREQVKQELSALVDTARRELIDCICIVHGIGEGVLKNALPHYLVQHPFVRAFHQAPLEYGGHGALLVLLDVNHPHSQYD